ncbi:AraC family transcriptional regulator [Lachnospiraceae bacterium]|nr:AraC family transcriptional regulator [Lachnospiraceae bacterium]
MHKKITVEEIERIVTQIRFENNENNLSRLPLEMEKRYFDKIREGRYREITFMDFERMKQVMGKSTRDSIKMFEYVTVSAIAMSTRAAIEGGMAADTAFDLSDGMLQRLEQAKTPEEMHDIIELTGIIMAHEVLKARMSRGSYLVEQIKNYVSSHIFKRIYLKDIAQYLGMSPEYISSMFSKQEQYTIQEYIQKKKTDVACNLLRYSEASIAEIAQYMGYQSQSNFSSVFKKWKKQSPSEYRMQNKSLLYTNNKK